MMVIMISTMEMMIKVVIKSMMMIMMMIPLSSFAQSHFPPALFVLLHLSAAPDHHDGDGDDDDDNDNEDGD